MGKFADLHKRWVDAKKKAPDQALAKKTFSKNLGPVLDELEQATAELLEARKSKFNPEKILQLSPKVEALCAKAAKIAAEYEDFAGKKKWGEITVVATKIGNEARAHGALEAKEWSPDKEYLALWRYVTLEMALSAAGLEDAKTAEDLRKMLEKKNIAINAAKKSDSAPRENIEKLSYVWKSREGPGDDFLKRRAERIAQAVAVALELANPASSKPQAPDAADKLKNLVKSVQTSFAGLVADHDRVDKDLKALKDYIKKPEVQNSAAWKKLGDDKVKTGGEYLKWYTTAVDRCKPEMAKLPKVT